MNVEHDLKENSERYSRLEKEFSELKNKLKDSDLTPRKPKPDDKRFIHINKMKYKANSANPSSGRKSTSESVQMFYSRNIKGPNNCAKEELVIPASSTRSPQKFIMQPGIHSKIVLKKDSRSPYIQADLDRLKKYVSIPKSKSHKRSKSQTIKGNKNIRKGAKSALKIKNVSIDKSHETSTYNTKDYSSIQNYNNGHFKSYDVRSSLNKYELVHPQGVIDMSMDKAMRKSTKKMKSKRHSSISKSKESKFDLSNQIY